MRAFLLVLALLLGLVHSDSRASAAEQEGTAVDRAKALFQLLSSPSPSVQPDSLWKAMEASESDLDRHLTSNPTDAEAVTLLMQIQEARQVATSFIQMFGGTVKADPGAEHRLALVERALEADSVHAELHYWRSRLLSDPKLSPEGNPLGIPRLEDALREANRAVSLAPEERAFRENLAFLTLVSGNESKAMAMYREMDREHPMYLRLHDWERVPRIEGTIAVPDSGEYLLPISHPLASIAVTGTRSYLFPGTVVELEASCRKNWPTFRFVADQDVGRYRDGTRRYAQHFSWDGDRLEPDADIADVQGGTAPGIGDGGIWIEVLERVALDSDPAHVRSAVAAGETYCWIELHNNRGF